MKQSDQRTAASPGPIAKAIFMLISILLSPISVLGYVTYVATLFLSKRTPGVSTTALGPLSARWTQHVMGVRKDEAAYRLMTSLLGPFPLGWYLVSVPTLLAHRLTGYVPAAFRYPFEGEVPAGYQASARQTFYDAVVERYLPAMSQFVILGAGFDTRAYRLPRQWGGRSFEVDAPKTQAVKRELLDKTGIDAAGVTFVSADFEKEDWLTKLIEAGFDRDTPALFILEGVIVYLDRQAVEDTFRKIASTAIGSTVAFDYFTTLPLESNGLYWRYGRSATKAAGEPMKFGIDSTPPTRERLAELLQSCGLTLIEQRTLGEESAVASQPAVGPEPAAGSQPQKRSWGGFAIAIVK
jgi:methyltransferase (TIGR00027 family)